MTHTKNLSSICLGTVLALMISVGCSPAAAQVPVTDVARPLITKPVDNSARTVIANSSHPLTRRVKAVGALNAQIPMQRMLMVLGADPVREHQGRTYLDALHTKGSPAYHQWLTPEQFGRQFGPSAQDVQQVKNWLVGQGFSVDATARSGQWIQFSGSVAAVQNAFQTQMLQYQVNGKLHTANAGNISIPAALSPVVRGLLSLHDFHSRPTHGPLIQQATATFNGGSPNLTLGTGGHAIVPADFTKIYDLAPLYSANVKGQGQTIAIVAASNIDLNDIANFRSLFGLPINQPTVIVNGFDPGADGADLQAEASLDAEWAGAVAPNAAIDVVVSGGSITTDPIALGSAYVVDQNLAQVLNVSFNLCEQELGQAGTAFWSGLWEQASAQGISVFVSSGDTGAAGCDANSPSNTGAGGAAVNGYASTAYNSSVGGTQFDETAGGGVPSNYWQPANAIGMESALGYIPERTWNESCDPAQTGSVCQLANLFLFLAGGGGVSTLNPTPSYQTLPIQGLSVLNNFTLSSSVLHPRGQPDISLNSGTLHDPYIFCFTPAGASPDCTGTNGVIKFNSVSGGTSFAAPAFSGIMALINQKVGSPQGLANYVLYSLAAAENANGCNSSTRTTPGAATACIFNDTTIATNGVPGNDITNFPTSGALGFPTGTGFDLATGLGSVDVTNLANAWVATAGSFQGSSTTLSASFNGTALPSNTVTITHGQPISATVSVARQNLTATQTPGGSISLVAQAGNLTSGAGLGSRVISGSGGTATSGAFNVIDLPGGTNYSLMAVFPGDGVFAGSTSAPLTVTVAPESSTTTVQSLILTANGVAAGNTVAYGDADNILIIDAHAAGVSGLTAGAGKVSFTFGNVPVGPVPVDNSGIAEIPNCFAPLAACLPPGKYTVTANYTGDGQSYLGSSSASIPVIITNGNPGVNVSSPASVLVGDTVTLGAKIALPALGTIGPTGAVQFLDGPTPLGPPVPLTSGLASAKVTLAKDGVHGIIAAYSGDAVYNSAISDVAVVTATSPFSLDTTNDTQFVPRGTTATFSVTLTGAAGFTGNVTFACKGAPAGTTCTINPGSATLGSTTKSATLTVTVSSSKSASLSPGLYKTLPFVFAGVLGILISLPKKPRQRTSMLMASCLFISLCGCGAKVAAPPPSDATITVTGTAANGVTNSIDLFLTLT